MKNLFVDYICVLLLKGALAHFIKNALPSFIFFSKNRTFRVPFFDVSNVAPCLLESPGRIFDLQSFNAFRNAYVIA